MNERLNISDLAGLLAEYTGKDRKLTELFLKELLVVVSDALLEERLVKVKGLGTFKVVQVEERESVHVNTGERFVIPAHSKFTFTPDKDLREVVNKPFSSFETTELNEGVVFSVEENEQSEDEDSDEVDSIEPEETPSPIETKVEELVKQVEEVKSIVPPEAEKPITTPAEPKKRNGTVVFLALFFVACAIGFFYFFNFNSSKSNTIKDIKQAEASVQESIPAEQAAPEEIAQSDSIWIEEQQAPDTMNIEPKETEEPVIVKIVPDTRLTLIALEHYGHKAFWVYIYEYNKDKITNPNNIRIGTELVLPAPALYGIDAKNPESVAKAKAKQAEINSMFN